MKVPLMQILIIVSYTNRSRILNQRL